MFSLHLWNMVFFFFFFIFSRSVISFGSKNRTIGVAAKNQVCSRGFWSFLKEDVLKVKSQKHTRIWNTSACLFFELVNDHAGIAYEPSRVCAVALSCPSLCNRISWACQASVCVEFSKQEYWSGLPFPTPLRSLCILIFLFSSFCFIE